MGDPFLGRVVWSSLVAGFCCSSVGSSIIISGPKSSSLGPFVYFHLRDEASSFPVVAFIGRVSLFCSMTIDSASNPFVG